jgi:hypothetical protein
MEEEVLDVALSDPPEFNAGVFAYWIAGKEPTAAFSFVVQSLEEQRYDILYEDDEGNIDDLEDSSSSDDDEEDMGEDDDDADPARKKLKKKRDKVKRKRKKREEKEKEKTNFAASAVAAAPRLKAQERDNSPFSIDASIMGLARLYVQDQYRMFDNLEQYLSQPLLFAAQLKGLLQISVADLTKIVELYYSLDDAVVKEVMCKKLCTRRDLLDISESSDIPMVKVSRQFNNLSRVYDVLDDSGFINGNLVDFMRRYFILPSNLARRYACILFFVYCKFDVSAKRRVLNIPSSNLERCAALVMAFLATSISTLSKCCTAKITQSKTSVYVGSLQCVPLLDYLLSGNGSESWDLVWSVVSSIESIDLDKQLLSNLREIRSALTGDTLDFGINIVIIALSNMKKKTFSGSAIARKLEGSGKTRTIVKGILLIGSNLSQTREFKDMFVDIITRVGEPLEEAGLSIQEINMFMLSCNLLVRATMENSRKNYSPELCSIISFKNCNVDKIKDWVRYVSCCRLCLIECMSPPDDLNKYD